MSTNDKSSNYIKVSMHLLAWIFLVILPQYLIFKYTGGRSFNPAGVYLNAISFGLIFYINYLWLIPAFYLKGKKTSYFVYAAMTILLIFFLVSLYYRLTYDEERGKAFQEIMKKLVDEGIISSPPPLQLFIYNFFLTSIIVTGLSLGLKVMEKHLMIEKEREQLEKEKLNSELSLLKKQISPHFFFNTLNNIYSLINSDTGQAGEAVLKLSKLMRYLLYESEQATIRLSREISFMENYIDLMRIRLNKRVRIDVKFPESGSSSISVPPLLFIPFIENAFKHGISYQDESHIDVAMTIVDYKVLFTCTNNKMTLTGIPAESSDDSGIGLDNVSRRLNLLFGDDHELKITDNERSFHVFLCIDTKKFNR